MWFTVILGILSGIASLISILHNLHSTQLLPNQAERRRKQGNNLIAKLRQLEGVLVQKCGCTMGGIEDATCMARMPGDE